MKKAATKSEKIHMGKVADLCCIACRKLGYKDTPAEIHHATVNTGFGGKASNFQVIPLCPVHHRHGAIGVAIHSGVKVWEEKFGTQKELLEEVKKLLD